MRRIFLNGTAQRIAVISILVTGFILTLIWLPDAFIGRLIGELIGHRFLLILLAVFALVALSVVLTAGHGIDTSAFNWINRSGKRPAWLDNFMWGVTQIGNGLTGFILGAAFYLLRYTNLAYGILLGMFSLWLTVEFFKALTERARPFYQQEETRIVGGKARGRSFPSGHTAQTFFLMSTLVQYYALAFWGSLFLYAIAFLVGITRMYVGAHYPRDVFGGAILGLVWGVMTSLLIT